MTGKTALEEATIFHDDLVWELWSKEEVSEAEEELLLLVR